VTERPVVVVGDVLLDVDLVAECERLSPEAPVPVLANPVRRRRPGGAGLAAVLAARTDRPVVLIAPVGSDAAAEEVRELLRDRVELVPLEWSGPTPVKTRLRVGAHPVARIDDGEGAGRIGAFPTAGRAALAGAAAVLVSDYGRGTTADPGVRAALADVVGRAPSVWDPHPRGQSALPGTRLVTPNGAELATLLGRPPSESLTAVHAGARALIEQWRCGAVAVTLGERGALLCVGEDPPLVAGSTPVRAVDSCGAGDAFAAATALALADGAVLSEAVGAAVRAAGRFVAAGGAAALAEPGCGADHGRPGRPDDGLRLADAVRTRGGRVVATGGCFDLLHAGHVAALEAARALGDCLVVCLNSDVSVRRLKGSDRPLQPQADRARVLGALECVDAVIVFDEDTPERLLRELRPHVWVKGGDYSGVRLPEAAVLAEWDGIAVTVPYLPGRSTSSLVQVARRELADRPAGVPGG
jgi:D-beta-D-heptose 7-phosphate kinase / D-beta-D-heptose 1-phosphate adenosyltransferase